MEGLIQEGDMRGKGAGDGVRVAYEGAGTTLDLGSIRWVFCGLVERIDRTLVAR